MEIREPKYPYIKVKLTGKEKNAFNIIGIIRKALKENDVPQAEITEVIDKMTQGGYSNLLRVAKETVKVS